MRTNIILLLVIIPILTFAQKDWFPIDATAEKVEISFYKQPVKSIDTINLENDLQVRISVWDLEVKDESHPNAFYSLGISTFPASILHSDSSYAMIEPNLDASAEPMIQNSAFEYLSSKFIMKDGYPGKDYKFRIQGSEGMLEMQTFMVENQLIQCSVITRPENWFNTTIDKFQNGLQFIGRGENKVDYGFTYIKAPSYKINFPSKPELQNMYTDTEFGKLNVRIEMLEGDLKTGGTLFMAGETKYPDSFQLTEENKEEQYSKSINGALNNTNATLVDRKILKRDGYEIVEFYATMYEGTLNAIYRVFWIGNASYIQAIMSAEKGMTKDAEAFFESFELLK